jgi:hypothetical protein
MNANDDQVFPFIGVVQSGHMRSALMQVSHRIALEVDSENLTSQPAKLSGPELSHP